MPLMDTTPAGEELEREVVHRTHLNLDWSNAGTTNNGNWFHDSFLEVGPEPGRIWDVYEARLTYDVAYEDATNTVSDYASVWVDFGFDSHIEELPDDLAGSDKGHVQDNDSIEVIRDKAMAPWKDADPATAAYAGRSANGRAEYDFADDPLTLWGGTKLHVNLAADNRAADADSFGNNYAQADVGLALAYVSEDMDR